MIKYLLIISFKENKNVNKDYFFKKKKCPQMSSLQCTHPNYPWDSGLQTSQWFLKLSVNKNQLIFKKLKIELLYDSAILLLGI